MEIEGNRSAELRLPAVLMLDTSGSMQGERINQAISSVKLFFETIKEDNDISNTVELSVVTFGESVKIVCDATLGKDLDIENIIPHLQNPHGDSPLGAAITKSIEIITERRMYYKDNAIKRYRPLVIIITNGVPTDEWEVPAKRIKGYADGNKLNVYALGVKDANFRTLEQITSKGYTVDIENEKFFSNLFKFTTGEDKITMRDPINTEEPAKDLLDITTSEIFKL